MSELKREKGINLIETIWSGGGGKPATEEFGRMTIEHLFGDVWQGAGLTVEERSLLTYAVLVALGREAEQRLHFRGARNLGISREELEAMITHMSHYAG